MEGIPQNNVERPGFTVPETTTYFSKGLTPRTAPTPKAVIENLETLHRANMQEGVEPTPLVEQVKPQGE